AILNVQISQPDSLIADALVTDVACNGDASGAIDLTVSGGVAGYTFEWSNGASSEDLTNLAAGTYFVTTTDMNDCVVISEFIIQQPSAISVTGIVTNVDCNGNTTGAIAITAAGGFGLLSFDWGGGVTIEDRTNLPAGIFMLTVTDENFCTKTESFEVTEPPVLVLDIA